MQIVSVSTEFSKCYALTRSLSVEQIHGSNHLYAWEEWSRAVVYSSTNLDISIESDAHVYDHKDNTRSYG